MIEKEVNFRTFTCIQIVCPPHTFCPDEICILGDLPHTMNALPVLRPQRVFKKNSIRLAGKYWQPCNSLFHTEILRKHYRKIKSDCAQYPVHPPVHLKMSTYPTPGHKLGVGLVHCRQISLHSIHCHHSDHCFLYIYAPPGYTLGAQCTTVVKLPFWLPYGSIETWFLAHLAYWQECLLAWNLPWLFCTVTVAKETIFWLPFCYKST